MESTIVMGNDHIVANLDILVLSGRQRQFHKFPTGQLHRAIIAGRFCLPCDLLVDHLDRLPLGRTEIQKVIKLAHGTKTEKDNSEYESYCIDESVSQSFIDPDIYGTQNQGSHSGYQQENAEGAICEGEVRQCS